MIIVYSQCRLFIYKLNDFLLMNLSFSNHLGRSSYEDFNLSMIKSKNIEPLSESFIVIDQHEESMVVQASLQEILR